MKMRNGFVSNSSSSSYVVYLPDNFKLNLGTPAIEKLLSEFYDHMDIDEFRGEIQEALDELMAEGEIGSETAGEGALVYILGPYIIASFDTGPDSGCIALANKDKIRQIQHENRQ